MQASQNSNVPFSLGRCLSILVLAAGLAACGGSDDSVSPPIDPPEIDQPTTPPEEPGPPPVIDISAQCPIYPSEWLAVDTALGAPITSKEDYVDAQFRWRPERDGSDVLTLNDARIRGRGNSSWGQPKKPYKLKLDKKTALYGMTKGKDWAILANYADKTLLRNALAFCMARTLELPYSPGSQFLELELNGRYDGVYQLTNKVYEITDLVEDEAKQPGTNADSTGFNDTFVLEMFLEAEITGRVWFGTDSNINYQFRSKVADEQQPARVQAWLNELEALIADRNDPQRMQKVAERMDVQSLVDFYLINELMGNQDAFRYSTYVYRRSHGKLNFGPVWDFDQALGLTGYIHDAGGWGYKPREENQYGWYFWELLHEPEFFALVQQRWQRLYALVPSYEQYVGDSAQALEAAAGRNFERWPILGVPVFTNAVAFDTYAEEVAYAQSWLRKRADWMQDNIGSITGR